MDRKTLTTLLNGQHLFIKGNHSKHGYPIGSIVKVFWTMNDVVCQVVQPDENGVDVYRFIDSRDVALCSFAQYKQEMLIKSLTL